MEAMNRIARWVALSLTLLSCLAAPANPASPQAPTVTRTVLLFSRLENQLENALARGDEASASAMLTDDFEQRQAAAPGTPIPRAEWLQAAAKDRPQSFETSQRAVRMLGETAVVSFLATQRSGASGGNRFLVDVWVQRDGNWKLAARYAASSPAQPKRRPTGKE